MQAYEVMLAERPVNIGTRSQRFRGFLRLSAFVGVVGISRGSFITLLMA